MCYVRILECCETESDVIHFGEGCCGIPDRVPRPAYPEKIKSTTYTRVAECS